MVNEVFTFSITGKPNQVKQFQDVLLKYGFKTTVVDQSQGYYFDIDGIVTIIAAILGANGLGAILSNIFLRNKKIIKIKVDEGKIKELEIKSNASNEQIEKLLNEIKKAFEDDNSEL